MATLSLTHTYVAGTLAKASEVNQNFSDLTTWANGNISNDNFDPAGFTGPLAWNITTGVKAIDINNSGAENAIDILQSVAISANNAVLYISDTAAQINSDSYTAWFSGSNASRTQPILGLANSGNAEALEITTAGAGVSLSNTGTGDSISVSNTNTAVGLKINSTSTGHIFQGQASGTDVFRVEDDGATYGLSFKLGSDDADGITLSKNAANQVLIENVIQLEDANGPILSKSGTNQLSITDSLDFGSGTLTLSKGVSDILVVNPGAISLSGSGPEIEKVSSSRIKITSDLLLESSGGYLFMDNDDTYIWRSTSANATGYNPGTSIKTSQPITINNWTTLYSGTNNQLAVNNKNVVVSDSGASTNLKIIQGIIQLTWNGSTYTVGTTSGNGYYVSGSGTNTIRFNWDNAFLSAPSVNLTGESSLLTNYTLNMTLSGTNYAQLGPGATPGWLSGTIKIHLIAIGRRAHGDFIA